MAVDPLDLGEDEGSIPVMYEGEQVAVLDLDEAVQRIMDWRKANEGRPEAERGESLKELVQALGVPVKSRDAADRFVTMIAARYTAVKKKTRPGSGAASPGSPGTTA